MSDCMLGSGEGAQPESSSDLDEEMWDRVEGVRHKLTRILNPAKLTPFLRQCKAIDEQDEDEVLNSTQYPLRISKAGKGGQGRGGGMEVLNWGQWLGAGFLKVLSIRWAIIHTEQTNPIISQ
uniref:Uncharacterized protein n=1 Tax=Paramormyrops kingsleyae TaxID=1676925 RepID=A0A3B3S3V3_9TELE